MNKLAIVVAFAVMANTATAGFAQDTVMQEQAVVDATAASSHAVIVPLLFLLIVAAAVSGPSGKPFPCGSMAAVAAC